MNEIVMLADCKEIHSNFQIAIIKYFYTLSVSDIVKLCFYVEVKKNLQVYN